MCKCVNSMTVNEDSIESLLDMMKASGYYLSLACGDAGWKLIVMRSPLHRFIVAESFSIRKCFEKIDEQISTNSDKI